jgi:hypothetical protein
MSRDRSRSPLRKTITNSINSFPERVEENLIISLTDSVAKVNLITSIGLSKSLNQQIPTILNNSTNFVEPQNMAFAISQTEMSMAKDMLPEYSGGSKNLAYFIKQVETYLSYLKKEDEGCLFNCLLFEQIKSKLLGEARDVLISSNCTKWTELKNVLLNRFGDPRSEELLANDLHTCFQLNFESYEQYYERVKNKLQILLEHISIRTPNRDILISKTEMYTSQALATFKSGIVESYCTHLMSSSILTLENALLECRKYDNNKAQVNFMNFMRQNSRKPVNKTDYSKSNNQKIK